ncbi:flagellar hook assembly protein FlgD [Inmirania thermothiophila]|uniref:Basal-body rod modification protein FlgD n=1 Tax=Inmirania thermothiophila TaxID=1750597 RepID=A0A3N1Y8T6_9GAMM|nr:flagellar hook assembly protein FlgD [Inmirania thermothiophila]ROR34908.1 flagellar basal-body rod modification protein FlgD [Inmirania thermothiophila]
MSTIADVAAAINPPQESRSGPRDRLGQEDFLRLMVTQLRNQDPFKPLQSGEFLGQIAQFGTVSGIQDLQQAFRDFADSMHGEQALRAAALVGRRVLVPGDAVRFDGEPVRGAVELDAPATELRLRVHDAAGALVRTVPLGAHEAGRVAFTWDGLDDAGAPVPSGRYRLAVERVRDGETVSLQPLVAAPVESVTLRAGGGALELELEGLGTRTLDDVRQIL